jgi:hypothetical protein
MFRRLETWFNDYLHEGVSEMFSSFRTTECTNLQTLASLLCRKPWDLRIKRTEHKMRVDNFEFCVEM